MTPEKVRGLVAALPCPTDPLKNARFRAKILDYINNDPIWADVITERCATDRPFFFNTFAHTFNPKLTEPHIPMILWPFQADYVEWIAQRIYTQKSGLTEKTREMTETWTKVAVFGWFLLFDNNAQFQVGSRKEELVDGKHPDAIMPKLDYLLERVPRCILDRCMTPDYKADKPWRTFKSLTNPKTRSNIYGEATNKNFGRGGRRRAIAIDEAAFIDYLEEIVRSAGMNTNCLLLGSTPNGMGGHFAKMRHSLPQDSIYRIHWTKHPEWAEGLYTCQPGCRAHKLGGKPHSPKYDRACEVYNWDSLAIAQELDIDYARSGNAVFDAEIARKTVVFLENNPLALEHYALHWDSGNKSAEFPSDMDAWYREAGKWRVRAEKVPGGPLRVYQLPFSCRDKRCLCGGTGLHTYVLGGDTAKGLAWGDADCAYILDITTETVAAEWHGRGGPLVVGVEWAKLAKWYGSSSGQNVPDAWCAVEWNESGSTVNDILDKIGLSLHVSVCEDKIRHTSAQYLGVKIDHNKKRLIDKYMAPELNNMEPDGLPRLACPFREFWLEVETFINLTPDAGKVNPEKTKVGGQRGCHDDRVMAMLCALYGAHSRYDMVKDYIETSGRYAVVKPKAKPLELARA